MDDDKPGGRRSPEEGDRLTIDKGAGTNVVYRYNREERLASQKRAGKRGKERKIPFRVTGFFKSNPAVLIILIDIVLVLIVFIVFRNIRFSRDDAAMIHGYSISLHGFSIRDRVFVHLIVSCTDADTPGVPETGPDIIIEPDGVVVRFFQRGGPYVKKAGPLPECGGADTDISADFVSASGLDILYAVTEIGGTRKTLSISVTER